MTIYRWFVKKGRWLSCHVRSVIWGDRRATDKDIDGSIRWQWFHMFFEMKKKHTAVMVDQDADSVKCEWTWEEIQTMTDEYQWTPVK